MAQLFLHYLFGQKHQNRWRNYSKTTKMDVFGQKPQTSWRNYFCICLAKNPRVDGATICAVPSSPCFGLKCRGACFNFPDPSPVSGKKKLFGLKFLLKFV